MTLNLEQYKLSEEEHQAIYEKKITPRLFKDVKTVENPVAVMFGGQPGCGKSTLVNAAVKEFISHGGAVKIDGDALRAFHPLNTELLKRDDKTAGFYTNADAFKWVDKAIEDAKNRKVNIVIEGTMRNSDVVADSMKNFRESGYSVYSIEARALTINPRLSEQGILLRYEKQKAEAGYGRLTPPEMHKAAYDGIPVTLERIEKEKLADRIALYRRNGEVIYHNELKNGEWTHKPQVCVALEAERNRPLSLQEHRDYVKGFDKISELLARPERKASAEEIHSAEKLRLHAKNNLAALEKPENKKAQAKKACQAKKFRKIP